VPGKRPAEYRLKEVKEINTLRVSLGLRPLQVGHKKCSRCGESFYSTDKLNESFCLRCKYIAKNTVSGNFNSIYMPERKG
jgi:formylmethanofuran dehydrogenase subunit E